MGNKDSKIYNPNANVVNKIQITMEYLVVYLGVIICGGILAVQLLVKMYQIPRSSIKKTYMRSMAIDIEKV